MVGKCGERRGAVDIRHFEPALPAADHPARDPRGEADWHVIEELRERAAEIAVAHVTHAERNAAMREDASAAVEAPGARGRRAPIDRDERRVRQTWPYQREAASSSLARASTQRSPSGRCSFFQNGARVF